MNTELYSKLDYRKIQFYANPNPIDVNLFISFLTIPIDRAGYVGEYTVQYQNLTHNLIIHAEAPTGKPVYLDSIQYKKRLCNAYNNYVNPFLLFDIMTEDGKKFFIDYYKDDINKLLDAKNAKFLKLKAEAEHAESELKTLQYETDSLFEYLKK